MQRRELLRPRLAALSRDQIIATYVGLTVGIIVLATIAVASVEIGPNQPLAEWPLWLSLTLLAALLERVRTDLFGDGKVSLSFVPLFAIALIIGPVPTVLAGAAVGLVTHVRPGARPLQVVFNSAVLGAAPAAGSLIYHLLTEAPQADLAAEQSAAMAGAAVTSFVLNTVTVAGVVSLSSGRSIRSVWVEKFLWAAPHYVGLAVLAYLVALAFSELGFAGIAGFLLPITLYQLSVGQYVRRTRGDVLRLQKNEERFRALVQRAPGLITIVNRQGKSQLVTPDSQIGVPDVMSQVHPDDAERVSALVSESIKQAGEDLSFDMRLRHEDGSWHDYEAVASNLLDNEAVDGIVVNARDVTERKMLEEQLRHQAFHDALTGLPNRALFLDRLEQALAGSRRRGTAVAVLLLDLNRFKVVNDSLGHQLGDELLRQVSGRLQTAVRSGDTLARFGGDEFTVLMEDLDDPNGPPATAAEQLLGALKEPFFLGGQESVVSASIGLALCLDGEEQPMEMLRKADAAMYQAKGEPVKHFVFYDEGIDAFPVERLQLESDLRHAIARDEFRVHYQPEVDLEDGRILGFEALVRWQHPERGLVPPAEFIPLAEETGDIVAIGQFVLEQACDFARAATQANGGVPVVLGVNLSPQEFLWPDLLARVSAELERSGIPGSSLRIEITEGTLMADTPTADNILKRLRALGVELAIDDFGTGYSSLDYLRRLPVDVIKIDQSFVRDMESDERMGLLVEGVVRIADALGLIATAEGIETYEQRTALRWYGCQRGQGYYFARPLERADALRAVAAGLTPAGEPQRTPALQTG